MRRFCYNINVVANAAVAQLVEHMLGKHEVAGPTPASSSKKEGFVLPFFVGRTRTGDQVARRILFFSNLQATCAVACNCVGHDSGQQLRKKSKGLIQSCQTFFSLHKGSQFLYVSKQQSLVGVNRTFARLFFLIYNNYGTKASSTERQINYGTIMKPKTLKKLKFCAII